VSDRGTPKGLRDRIEARRRVLDRQSNVVAVEEAVKQNPANLSPIRQAVNKALSRLKEQTPTFQKLDVNGGLRRLTTSTESLAQETYNAVKKSRAALDATRLASDAADQTVKNLRTMLAGTDKTKIATIDKLVSDYVSGKIDDSALAQGLRNMADTKTDSRQLKNHIKLLIGFRSRVRENGKVIADQLRKAYGKDSPLADAIENNPAYLTRFYEKHILGGAFEPDAQAKADAITMIKNTLEADIEAMQANTRAAMDITTKAEEYINTGEEKLLEGLSVKQRNILQSARSSYQKMKDIIESEHFVGNREGALVTAERLESVARSTVNEMLEMQPDKIGNGKSVVGSLMKRTLDNPVIQRLFGKVDDPAKVLARSIEVQQSIMARHAMMESIAEGGSGRLYSSIRDDAKGFTVQIPDQPNSFGRLAGQYTTPELAEAIGGYKPRIFGNETAQKINDAGKTLFGTLARLKRSFALMSPKSLERNFITSITHFAAGSGDIGLRTWLPRMNEGLDLVRRAVNGDVSAIKALEVMARDDIFRIGCQSIIDDIKMQGKGKLAKCMNEFHKMYAYTDFFTKYAAYKARMDAGMSREQAIQHVHDYYQYREALPGLSKEINKSLLGSLAFDYQSYKFDSLRILVNQFRGLAKAIQDGDKAEVARKFIGIVVGRTYWAATRFPVIAKIGAFATSILSSINKDKSKDDPEEETLGEHETGLIRSVLADFDKDEGIVATRQVNPTTGEPTLRVYIIGAGSVGAFPIEDFAIGTLQALAQGGDPKEMFSRKIMEGSAGLGMLPQYGKKWYDLLNQRDEMSEKLFFKKAKDLGVDAMPQVMRQMLKIYRADESQRESQFRASQGKDTSFDSTVKPSEQLSKMFDLVRVYRMERSDLNKGLANAGREFARVITKEQKNIRAEMQSPDANKDSITKYQDKRREVLEQSKKIIQVARGLDPEYYTFQRIDAVLKEAGLGSKKLRAALINDNVIPEYQVNEKD
jgi:hypothetical protein